MPSNDAAARSLAPAARRGAARLTDRTYPLAGDAASTPSTVAAVLAIVERERFALAALAARLRALPDDALGTAAPHLDAAGRSLSAAIRALEGMVPPAPPRVVVTVQPRAVGFTLEHHCLWCGEVHAYGSSGIPREVTRTNKCRHPDAPALVTLCTTRAGR